MTKQQKHWTLAEEQRLRELYGRMPASAIAAGLGRSKASIKNRVHILGLTKGENTGCFPKGHAPWNKGTSYTAGGRSAETRFKPGERRGVAVRLYKPIGSERISKDGYLERKINDGMPLQKRWRAVHLIEWEAINGPLPAGHALAFKDGNKTNRALENLELVTRSDLMRRNSVHNYGPEIARIHQLQGAITRQINKRQGKSK